MELQHNWGGLHGQILLISNGTYALKNRLQEMSFFRVCLCGLVNY